MVLPHSLIPLALQVLALVARALSVPMSRLTSAPLVTLDYGTFQGFNSAEGTESFLGLPFAQPPIGQFRFNDPVPPKPFSGVRNATQFGNACPQRLSIGSNGPFPDIPGLSGYLAKLLPGALTTNISEDCLYLNVVRPTDVSIGADLPVIVWIYGGGFELGDTSEYDGIQIVSRSLSLKLPVIYVSFNYRLNVFGFLGGKEIQREGLGNFGLRDQRLALQWVQKYIYIFGGNPQQVILWGQSAGSMSVFLQMVAYNGQLDGLFQGAVMESGSVTQNSDIASQAAQDRYNFILEQTHCTAANDTLNCLRQVSYNSIQNAALQLPPVLSYEAKLVWEPLIDGVFLKQSTSQSLSQGKYAQVPAILSDVDDEGTLLSLFSFNVTTNDEFLVYIQSGLLPNATEEEIQKVGMLYPEDPTLGSPYNVGTNDTLTPEYKRISSFLGDLLFQAPRRYTLRYLSQTQNVWSYLWKRNKDVPALGSFHGSDLTAFYNFAGNTDRVGVDVLVNFAYTLNPNVPHGGYPSGAAQSPLSNICWPQYHIDIPLLLTFKDSNVFTLTNDTYRTGQIEFLEEIQYGT